MASSLYSKIFHAKAQRRKGAKFLLVILSLFFRYPYFDNKISCKTHNLSNKDSASSAPLRDKNLGEVLDVTG